MNQRAVLHPDKVGCALGFGAQAIGGRRAYNGIIDSGSVGESDRVRFMKSRGRMGERWVGGVDAGVGDFREGYGGTRGLWSQGVFSISRIRVLFTDRGWSLSVGDT